MHCSECEKEEKPMPTPDIETMAREAYAELQELGFCPNVDRSNIAVIMRAITKVTRELRVDNERLRGALETILSIAQAYDVPPSVTELEFMCSKNYGIGKEAKKALAPQSPPDPADECTRCLSSPCRCNQDCEDSDQKDANKDDRTDIYLSTDWQANYGVLREKYYELHALARELAQLTFGTVCQQSFGEWGYRFTTAKEKCRALKLLPPEDSNA